MGWFKRRPTFTKRQAAALRIIADERIRDINVRGFVASLRFTDPRDGKKLANPVDVWTIAKHFNLSIEKDELGEFVSVCDVDIRVDPDAPRLLEEEDLYE